MFDAEAPAGSPEALRAIRRAVIGENASDLDAQAPVVTHQTSKETRRAKATLVAIKLAVGHACMIVDRDVQELPASARRFELAVPMHPVSGTAKARQALNIQVHQLPGMLMLVALHRRLGV